MPQQYMHLIGAEDAVRAGNEMRESARLIRGAVDNMQDILQRHQQMVQDFQIWYEEKLSERNKS